MITRVLFNKISIDTYKKELKEITKKELINLSNKLELDVIYLLKGVK